MIYFAGPNKFVLVCIPLSIVAFDVFMLREAVNHTTYSFQLKDNLFTLTFVQLICRNTSAKTVEKTHYSAEELKQIVQSELRSQMLSMGTIKGIES